MASKGKKGSRKLNQAWSPIIRLLWLFDADKLDSIQGGKLQVDYVKQWLMVISREMGTPG
jgi:hypothetical protein